MTTIADMRHRDYDKVQDMLDTRVPLHNEEAFQHGIKLKAKVFGERISVMDKTHSTFYSSSLGA